MGHTGRHCFTPTEEVRWERLPSSIATKTEWDGVLEAPWV